MKFTDLTQFHWFLFITCIKKIVEKLKYRFWSLERRGLYNSTGNSETPVANRRAQSLQFQRRRYLLYCISPEGSTSVSAAINGNIICCTDRAASGCNFKSFSTAGSSIKSTAQPVYRIEVMLMLYLFHLPFHINSIRI